MTDQYVPDEDEMRHAYRITRLLDHHAAVDAAVDRFLAHVRRDAEAELDSWMTRAYEAEKRAWKAEKRLAGWVEHWNATARTGAVDEVAAVLEANARADRAEARVAEEKHLRMKATAAATKAEARIKAVRDVLDRWQVDGYDALLRRIRRALDGDA